MTRLVGKEAVERVVGVIIDELVAVVDILTIVMVVLDNQGCLRNHHSQHSLVDCHLVLSKEILIIYSKI